jgi:hypothetical protein
MTTLAPTDDVRPILLIDTRDALAVRPSMLKAFHAQLPIASSYSFVGGKAFFCVKRIPLASFAACVKDSERMGALLVDLRAMANMDFSRLIVVGDRDKLADAGVSVGATAEEIYALGAFVDIRTRVPIVFAPTQSAALLQVESWALLAARLKVFGFDSTVAAVANERMQEQDDE